MLFDNKIEKVLEIFIKKPTQGFQYRELNRRTKLGSSTIKRSLKQLEKKNLIKKRKGKIYPYYEANIEDGEFKLLKIFYTIKELNKILKIIIEKTRPNCIILFGSASKGEDTEKSDIDLFIQSKRKDFDFNKNEKNLNRKINLIFEPFIDNISKELLNNLANGITLYGFLEVKK